MNCGFLISMTCRSWMLFPSWSLRILVIRMCCRYISSCNVRHHVECTRLWAEVFHWLSWCIFCLGAMFGLLLGMRRNEIFWTTIIITPSQSPWVVYALLLLWLWRFLSLFIHCVKMSLRSCGRESVWECGPMECSVRLLYLSSCLLRQRRTTLRPCCRFWEQHRIPWFATYYQVCFCVVWHHLSCRNKRSLRAFCRLDWFWSAYAVSLIKFDLRCLNLTFSISSIGFLIKRMIWYGWLANQSAGVF